MLCSMFNFMNNGCRSSLSSSFAQAYYYIDNIELTWCELFFCFFRVNVKRHGQ